MCVCVCLPRQLRCRRGTEEVDTQTTVTMRECVAGEILPDGIATCVECEEGAFGLVPGQRVSQCDGCPAGAACAGGSHLVAQAGKWRFSPHHLTFFECEVPSACTGYTETPVAVAGASARLLATVNGSTGGAGSNDGESSLQLAARRQEAKRNAVEGCGVEYRGTLCSRCQPGYGKLQGLECTECLPPWASYALMVLGVLLVLGAISILIRQTIKDGGQISTRCTLLRLSSCVQAYVAHQCVRGCMAVVEQIHAHEGGADTPPNRHFHFPARPAGVCVCAIVGLA